MIHFSCELHIYGDGQTRFARLPRKLSSIRFLATIALVLFALSASVLAQKKAPWPQRRANIQNSGLAIGAGALPIVKWTSLPIQNCSVVAAVTIDANGIIYTTGTENYIPYLYAFDSVTGLMKLRSSVGNPTGTVTIGGDGTLYCSGISSGTTPTVLLALDPTTGAIKWSREFGFKISTEFTIDKSGSLYLNCGDGYFYSIDSATGDVNWSFDPNVNHVVGELPAIGPDGTLYFPGTGEDLVAMDPIDATVKWDWVIPNGNQFANGVASPVVVGPEGNVYFSDFYADLYALDGQSGKILWERDSGTLGTNLVMTIAVGPDGTVYSVYPFVNSHGLSFNLGAFGAGKGELLWNYVFSEDLTGASPVIAADGTIYVDRNSYGAGNNGFLYAFDGVDGSVKWFLNSVTGDPAIGADGTLYLATSTGEFVSLVALLSINVASVTFTPSSVQGGNASTGTVTVTSPAQPGGAVVSLLCDTSVATIPVSVTVPTGQISANFNVTTTPVSGLVVANVKATLGNTITGQLTITPAVVTGLSLNPTTVQGGDPSTGTVTLSGLAGPSGLSVALSSGNSSATVPSSLLVAAGQTTGTFTVKTSGVNTQTSVVITATLGPTPQTASLTINPATLSSVSLNPSTVGGGGSSTGTVTLSGPAGSGGTVVTLASSNATATVPASVTVAAGKTTGTFTVSTTAVSSSTQAVITASLNGTPQTATLTITPATLSSLAVSPTSVLGGTPSTGTVTLSGKAGPSGAVVSLSSGNAAATVPSSITVPAGQSSISFSIATTGVSTSTQAVITATLSGTPQTATLTITPATLVSVSLAPTSVVGGNSSTGTVTLSGPAGSGGTAVSLSSSNSISSVPSSVTVASGKSSATFMVTTSGVNAQSTSIVTATLAGTPQTATLTITPAPLVSLTLNPSTVTGGNASTGTVTLGGVAGPGGTVVSLSSGNAAATVPSSVTVGAGQTSGTFTVGTSGVSSQVSATITGTLNSTPQSATLTIKPSVLVSVSLNPNSVAGSTTSTGTVTLSGPAGSGGVLVGLSSSSSSASVPSVVSVPAGQTSATFAVSAALVTTKTLATISASLGSVTQTAILTLNPITLFSVSLNPDSVSGGNPSTGTATLNGPSPKGGTVVKLSSSLAGVTVPASVTIPMGAMSVSFKVTTVAVSTQKVATITGKVGKTAQSATLTVNPPVLSSIVLTPTTLTGGSTSSGTVTLTGPAPAGGMVVKLSSSLSAAIPPATVTVPAGKTMGIFMVKTSPVGTSSTATISASLNGTTVTASLTINPPVLTSLTLSPSTVAGGKNSTGTVTISAAAPTGGMSVTLASSLTSATVPQTVTILAGRTSATFSVKTTKVTSKTTSTISASKGGMTKTAVLTIS